MKIYQLVYKQNIRVDIQTVWSFFSNPSNLKKITPPSMGFDIVFAKPEEMYDGQIIVYKVSPLLGIKMTWVTEISHVNNPHYFVDEQRIGPYAFWYHEHFFNTIENGTEIIDKIHYGIPMGLVGQLMNPLMVKPKLKTIFDYRKQRISEIFGSF